MQEFTIEFVPPNWKAILKNNNFQEIKDFDDGLYFFKEFGSTYDKTLIYARIVQSTSSLMNLFSFVEFNVTFVRHINPWIDMTIKVSTEEELTATILEITALGLLVNKGQSDYFKTKE